MKNFLTLVFSKGNGLQCDDINECLTNNGGCSKYPMVTCMNTPGSYYCGSCPAGYEGDGYNCEPSSPCIVNNGGCYPDAACTVLGLYIFFQILE